MKYILILLISLVVGACDRPVTEPQSSTLPEPTSSTPTVIFTEYGSYLGTIDTMTIAAIHNKPHRTDFLSVYTSGTWNVNVTDIQSSSSVSGNVVTINLTVSSGLLQVVSGWNYAYGMGFLAHGT